ncbi:MAG TPA: (2Fe-2S) ferredoxin domain-containing protein [Candidatus Hydrogenedens sp.]|nr:(2Fe-2S) ferredoxin domain-containing protein [Candidatus Hydrogenedens sp.]HOK10463.1 (2Fe-2S) ferredoxin domain-containing protein [Candidatus Hydrogenedens sp.]HOL19929.1 (2Fe-2S) ferredoxin domain-containing protein [Candidatus Hydrogenedens sp.]HPP59483.1 (2Fe-2S) ferredoxin domain-containing protein [Candidatus Hydrogenedens sp.]
MADIIRSPEDLNALKEKALKEINIRSQQKELVVTVHMGTCGIAAGARDVLKNLVAELSSQGIDYVTVRQSGCAGLCDREPMITVLQKSSGTEYRYGKLNAEKVRTIVQQHIISGKPVMEYLIS